MELPNPLHHFPVNKDSTIRSFLQSDVKKHTRKIEGTQSWLNPLQIDPTFGLKGTDQISIIKRSYRRIESSKVFVTPKLSDSSLAELVDDNSSGKKKLILIEEGRLAEYYKFESILRLEKLKLEEQCLLVNNPAKGFPQQSPPHIPIPATRMAMHSACEKEMKSLAAEMQTLNAQWLKFSRSNGYGRLHKATAASMLDSMPVGLRLVKLRQLQEEEYDWWLGKERDTMMFEDDMSRLVNKYVNAQNRRKDYDRYYILASRYGVWSAEKFASMERPGHEYWTLALSSVLLLQRVWNKYWTETRVKRYKAATMIQANWRCYITYKKLHPLVRLRMRVGRRAHFAFCWKLWLEYNAMCKRIRECLKFAMVSWNQKCFNAWKAFYTDIKLARERVLRKFILRMKNMELAGIYMTWVDWVRRRKNTKRFMRRLLQCPQFELWLEYVAWSKEHRRLSKAAVIIQAFGRRIIERRKYLWARLCIVRLGYFGLIVLARKEARRRRGVLFDQGFSVWKPKEEEKLLIRASDEERRRLVRQQQAIQDKEYKALAELKRHLASYNGSLQLTEIGRDIKEGVYSTDENPNKNLSPSAMLQDLAKKDLIRRCKILSRALEKHEFNIKNPPFIRCADPLCSAVFTCSQQYHMHVRKSAIHHKRRLVPMPSWCTSALDSELEPVEEQQVLFSHIHLQMKHKSGVQFLSQYFARKHKEYLEDTTPEETADTASTSPLQNCLDFWLALQDWHRTSSLVENYYNTKAYSILETFLKAGCPRPLPLNSSIFEGSPSSAAQRVTGKIHAGFAQSIKALKRISFRMNLGDPTDAAAATAVDGGASIPAGLFSRSSSNADPNVSKPSPVGAMFGRSSSNAEAISSPMGLLFNRISSNGPGSAGVQRTSSANKYPIPGIKYRHSGQVHLDSQQYQEDQQLMEFVESQNQLANAASEFACRRISAAQECPLTKRSQFTPAIARLTTWRKLMRMNAETFEQWNDVHIIPANVFDELEWFCFRTVFTALALDPDYPNCAESQGYQDLLQADAAARLTTLKREYSEQIKFDLRKWTSQFKYVEMAISRRAEDLISKFMLSEMEFQVSTCFRSCLQEHVFEVSEQEQKVHEGLAMQIDEAVDWVAIDTAAEVYEFYTATMLKQMWEIPEMKRKLLVFVGLATELPKKKLFVDMSVSGKASKAALDEFFSK